MGNHIISLFILEQVMIRAYCQLVICAPLTNPGFSGSRIMWGFDDDFGH